MKFKYWILVFTSSLGFIWGGFTYWPDGKLHLVVCDVGQGDAILIKKGFNEVLVDGGPNNKILECLSNNLPFWEKTIELVVLTHPDNDHVTGLVEVLKRFKVKRVVANSLWVDRVAFTAFREVVAQQEIDVFSPKKGDRIRLAGMSLETLWPKERLGNVGIWSRLALSSQEAGVLGVSGYQDKTNEDSIVFWLKYGSFDVLLPGDIGEKQEEKVVGSYGFEGIEVLKVAHHGSKYSTSQLFLEKIKPKIALISVGKNSWGHPTKEVLERLGNMGVGILRTDERGEIEIVSDGKSFVVE